MWVWGVGRRYKRWERKEEEREEMIGEMDYYYNSACLGNSSHKAWDKPSLFSSEYLLIFLYFHRFMAGWVSSFLFLSAARVVSTDLSICA